MTDPTADPLDILLRHNHWATGKILDLCRGLTIEEFTRNFAIGPGETGGLHATLTHIVGCMRRWADRIAERPMRPSIERPRPEQEELTEDRLRMPDELTVLLAEATDDLAQVIQDARASGLGALVRPQFGGKVFTFTKGAAITHVLTHGNYHRAQCMNMLRRLRDARVPVAAEFPDLDVSDWQVEEETGEGQTA